MSRRGAFTLMEVLLATAIGALLVAAALGALSVAVDAFNAVSASGGADAERARFVAAIGADVASAAPLGGVRFSGGRNAMSFARLASQTRSTNGVEVVRVEWGASADGGTVRTLTRADGTCVREKFGGVRGRRLRYAGRPAGAEAAARRYYKTSAAGLGSAQAAHLAAMIPNPRFYETHRAARGLLRRQGIIAARMGMVSVPR